MDARLIAGKKLIDATLKAYGSDQVKIHKHEIGPEVTQIMGLSKSEIAGFQAYICFLTENGLEQAALPSYTDEADGKKKLLSADELTFEQLDKFLRKLPKGTTLAVVWQLDKDRMEDVNITEKSVMGTTPKREQRNLDKIEPPKCIGCGGDDTRKAVDLSDTSVEMDPEKFREEKKRISIMKMEHYMGERDNPVDLGQIVNDIARSVQNFDGTPMTLKDLQYVIFIAPKGQIPVFDGMKIEAEINVSLLEVIGKQKEVFTPDPIEVLVGPLVFPSVTNHNHVQESNNAVQEKNEPDEILRSFEYPKYAQAMHQLPRNYMHVRVKNRQEPKEVKKKDHKQQIPVSSFAFAKKAPKTETPIHVAKTKGMKKNQKITNSRAPPTIASPPKLIRNKQAPLVITKRKTKETPAKKKINKKKIKSARKKSASRLIKAKRKIRKKSRNKVSRERAQVAKIKKKTKNAFIRAKNTKTESIRKTPPKNKSSKQKTKSPKKEDNHSTKSTMQGKSKAQGTSRSLTKTRKHKSKKQKTQIHATPKSVQKRKSQKRKRKAQLISRTARARSSSRKRARQLSSHF
jgi:hypothetical protein